MYVDEIRREVVKSLVKLLCGREGGLLPDLKISTR